MYSIFKSTNGFKNFKSFSVFRLSCDLSTHEVCCQI